MRRAYDDPCGIARALNLVGERWALLIVRELMLGPKRFSDLRRGLPGASQSVLTQRLGELEDAGVLARRRLGPPVGAAVYELTEQGRALDPVLLALSNWGSRRPLTSAEQLSVDALVMAMRSTYSGHDGELTIALTVDGDELTAVVRAGRLDIARRSAAEADATISTTASRLRAALFTGAALDDGEVGGDPSAAATFLRLFPRPAAG
ncbi:winged helix-turn-helix transcriptional regulator [Dactylosporangium sp. McL0621]|uniref:winged helix-turn-helix transcriptional regulator n=1 Tax=Dactylosporangium sp. McL0621 TaxID=3415678 RepID=UPI003CF77A6B